MMKRFFLFLLWPALANAQFAPAAGQPGSSAIHKDSTAIIAWARTCQVNRGWQDISDHSFGTVTHGEPVNATSKADGLSVVSLGDGGEAILTFDQPIRNGNGPDLCVFENSFDPGFLELAFVEVSSDGMNFVRFPATSNNSSTLQLGPFDTWSDPSKLNNLAGKYVAGYGVPFDLEELKDVQGVNVSAITHVRIVDVVGSILPVFARKDKNFNTINDPWPTAFPQGGFDLDAVGVLNQAPLSVTETKDAPQAFNVYPTLVRSEIHIESNINATYRIEIMDLQGRTVRCYSELIGNTVQSLDDIEQGTYFIKVLNGQVSRIFRILKQD